MIQPPSPLPVQHMLAALGIQGPTSRPMIPGMPQVPGQGVSSGPLQAQQILALMAQPKFAAKVR